MKHKYFLEKHLNEGRYTLQEQGELDNGIYSVLCNESYDAEAMDKALTSGRKSFFAVLRTDNMFPAEYLAGKIYEAALALKDAKEDERVEILFDDLESLPSKDAEPDPASDEEEDKEAVELEGLLDDDDDDEAYMDQDELKTPDPVTDASVRGAGKAAPDLEA